MNNYNVYKHTFPDGKIYIGVSTNPLKRWSNGHGYYFNEELDKAIKQLQQENKILKENAENNDKVVDKVNWENMLLKKENKQLKDLIDTILNFSFFKEECPLNFGFENNTNEDKSQSIFYEDEWCENNCNDNYKDCWLKYFKKLQELEQGSDSNDRPKTR